MKKKDITMRNFNTSPELENIFVNLYGINPKTPIENRKIRIISNSPEQLEINWKRNAETGSCFRNMNSDWAFLSAYIYENIDVLNKKDMDLFFDKKNKVMSEEKSVLLSLQLQYLINTGHTSKFCETIPLNQSILEIEENGIKKKIITTFKWFNVENVQFFTTFCKNSGGFRINGNLELSNKIIFGRY